MIRHFLRLLCITMMTVTMLTGCSDKNGTGPGDGDSTFLRASVSGTVTLNFEASTPVGLYDAGTMTVTGTMTSGGNSYVLVITIHTSPKTGTFQFAAILEDFTNKATGVFTVNNVTGYWSVTGTVTMTEVGNRLKGTFQFTAEDPVQSNTINLTNGSFDVPAAEVT